MQLISLLPYSLGYVAEGFHLGAIFDHLEMVFGRDKDCKILWRCAGTLIISCIFWRISGNHLIPKQLMWDGVVFLAFLWCQTAGALEALPS